MLEEPQKMPKARMRENIYNTCCRRRLIKLLANAIRSECLKVTPTVNFSLYRRNVDVQETSENCFSSTLNLNWDTVSAVKLPILI